MPKEPKHHLTYILHGEALCKNAKLRILVIAQQWDKVKALIRQGDMCSRCVKLASQDTQRNYPASILRELKTSQVRKSPKHIQRVLQL